MSADCAPTQVCLEELCIESTMRPPDEGGSPSQEGTDDPDGEEEPTEGPGGEGEAPDGSGGGGAGGDAGEGEGAGDDAPHTDAGSASGGDGDGGDDGDDGDDGGDGGNGGDAGTAPTCTPACGAIQRCVATNICANEPGADVCSTFGASTIDFFESQPLTLNAAEGDRFIIDDADRLLLHKRLDARPGMEVQVTVMSSAFDAMLFAYEDTGAQCTETERVDVTVAGAAETLLVSVGTTPTDLVIASYDPISSPAGSGGALTLEARGVLCGLQTEDRATYDRCFRALYETPGTQNTCANNPCERVATDGDGDGRGDVTGDFCCINASCRSGFGAGDVIRTFPEPSNICVPDDP